VNEALERLDHCLLWDSIVRAVTAAFGELGGWRISTKCEHGTLWVCKTPGNRDSAQRWLDRHESLIARYRIDDSEVPFKKGLSISVHVSSTEY
jgi:hypothetical protein